MIKKIMSAFESIKKALIVLVLFVALFTIVVIATDSINVLKQANAFLILIATLAFLASVFIWLISWAWTIKKDYNISYASLLLIGFSSLFASLTPMQLGADALRALLLKETYKVPFSKGISASMFVKGLKFFTLLIVSLLTLFFLIANAKLNLILLLLIASGLFVIFIATALFLFPFNKVAAFFISSILTKLTKKIRFLEPASAFFLQYSNYLKRQGLHVFSLLLLCIVSWFFEFLAFTLSFAALNIFLPLHSFILLFVIVAILERVPFMPRGLLFVEAASYLMLSTSFAGLSQKQIVSFLAIFDFVRIVVPVVLSMIVFTVCYRTLRSSKKKQVPQ